MVRFILVFLLPVGSFAQLQWKNVDSLYQPLPPSIHVYFSDDSLYGKPNRAFYLEADLQDRTLQFSTDTTSGRRLTPDGFYHKNGQPLVVVNCTFFEFVHNSNLNLVANDGKLLAHNAPIIGRGRDTFTYQHTFVSAIGITKKRKADIAWTVTNPALPKAYAIQKAEAAFRDSNQQVKISNLSKHLRNKGQAGQRLKKWRVNTAVGGGPVLIQGGNVSITNNEELKFAGKAIDDRHPRTGIGYTTNNKLIILVVEGRFPGKAEGATLTEEANIFKQIGCIEAMNLDGGGSSCLLVNGKGTIVPSDKEGQRPVPAVFLISIK